MSKVPSRLNSPPMSPHLEIWRWHVTMLSSILHRASGVALYVGAVILTGWVASLAMGPAAFFAYRRVLHSWYGMAVMFGLTLAVFYHLANGIRYLGWAGGAGLEVKTANTTAIAAISFAVVAALAIWLLAGRV